MAGSHGQVSAESVAAQLDKARRSGDGWLACCPAHDDHNPSLSIKDGENGKVLVRCHAGCHQRDVFAALKARSISLNGQAGPAVMLRSSISATKAQKREAIIPVPDDAPEFIPPAGTQYVFEYRDIDGRLHFIVSRKDTPLGADAPSRGAKDHSKEIRPWVYTSHGWKNQGSPNGRIPYGLPDLARCGPERVIAIVQGELKRDEMQKLLPDNAVLTYQGGDSSVLHTDWSVTAQRKVAIWPDNDDSGRKAAQRLASHLHGLGCTVRVLEPPADLGSGEDVHDLIKRGQFTDEVLRSMCHAASDWSAGAEPAVGATNDFETHERNDEDKFASGDEPSYQRAPLDWPALAEQTPPARDWAIPKWLGLGHVTLLAGEGGSGKSLLAQATATALAAAKPYFFEGPVKKRSVLMWAGEDDHDELWRRQIAINAYLGIENLCDLDGSLILEPFDGRDMLLAAPWIQMPGQLIGTSMLKELRAQVGDYGADVVILDTISRIFGGNENDRGHVTRFIAMLNGAMPHSVALLLLAHPSRTPGAEFSGSSAWEGSVRSRLLFGRKLPDAKREDADDPGDSDDTVRFLSRRKANYSGRDYAAFNYDIEKHVLVPQTASKADDFYRHHHARDVLREGLRELMRRNLGHPTGKATSPNRYLPKMIRVNGLSKGVPDIELKRALNALLKEGKLREVDEVGKDAAGRPQSGLVET